MGINPKKVPQAMRQKNSTKLLLHHGINITGATNYQFQNVDTSYLLKLFWK